MGKTRRTRSGLVFLVAIGVAVVGSPIRAARADDAAPLFPSRMMVDVEPCWHRFTAKGITYRVAEHRYPRRDAATLAGVSVYGRREVPFGVETDAPPGYQLVRIAEGVWVRDGGITVVCGTVTDLGFEAIVFATPRSHKIDLDPAEPW